MRRQFTIKRLNLKIGKQNHSLVLVMTLLSILIGTPSLLAQTGKFTVKGTIYEKVGTKQAPLPYGVVSLKEYSMHKPTGDGGEFVFENVPAGEVTLTASTLGKVPIDTVINVRSDMTLTFVMQDDDFRVKDVIVTAQSSKAGESTSSIISRTAIDHLQATSLKDVLSLLPGSVMTNQNLSYMGTINLRAATSRVSEGGAATGNAVDMNAMGVSIIRDGAPISNNANMQSLSTSMGTMVGSTGGGSGPVSGIDSRSISTDNIESIEVIQGIPSVEYGDVTSGVIIINSKAGHDPIRVNAKLNPNVYQFSVGAGHELKKNRGALNYGVDYAHNTRSLVESYKFYERSTLKLLYSNSLLNNRWSTNTSLDLIYGRNRHRENPDDKINRTASGMTEKGFSLSTNGTIFFNQMWLNNIKYVGSVSYTARDSHSQGLRSGSDDSYSGSTIDGAILTNLPGEDFYDEAGNKITNIAPEDRHNYASSLNEGYLSRYIIEGRELNLYGKVTATFVNNWSRVNNTFFVGADFRSSSNNGGGRKFIREQVPMPPITTGYGSYRPYSYGDIPYVNTLGIFIEDKLRWEYSPRRNFTLQAGLRYDNVSAANSLVAPRINASLEIVPRIFSIKGGYGVTGKMPTVSMLHPENAYYEFRNYSNMTTESDPAKQRLMTTTRVLPTSNPDLKIAKNSKAEIGFDLSYGQFALTVTGFRERMKNGYAFGKTVNTFVHDVFNKYSYNPSSDRFTHSEEMNVLLPYNTPTNNLVLNTDGVEFDLDLGRFDAIRTSFILNGAWMRTETYNKDYSFYSGIGYNRPTHVGVYDKAMERRFYQRFITTLRATHNIPELGFVVTLSTQVIWNEKDWYEFNNEVIPVKYISTADGTLHAFPYTNYNDAKDDAEFAPTLRSHNPSNDIPVSLSPLLAFNVNVTKEIGDFMRVSFFANNMFRSYPVVSNPRAVGEKIQRNSRFFFGLELSLIIK